MKKFLSIIAASLLFATAAMAQMSITTPSQSLKLAFKGAQVVGDDVEITLLLTNVADAESVVNLVGGQYQTGMSGSVAFDNEGNIYEIGDVLVSIGNKSYTEQYSAYSLPAGVPVKCHVLVKGVDKAATSLTKVKLCVLAPQLAVTAAGVCFEINNVSFK